MQLKEGWQLFPCLFHPCDEEFCFACELPHACSTGDSFALALKHGVELQDLNYIQIHPTTLTPKSTSVLMISGEDSIITLTLSGLFSLMFATELYVRRNQEKRALCLQMTLFLQQAA